MSHVYTGLSRAQLSYDYLHTNSTTHEFLFGALAEIVDNSRDALAKTLEIFTVSDRMLRGGTMLCFLDDGEGMDPTETANVITFGLSQKKSMDSTQIGQYGNGLKSASMRIANDLIVFTKKGDRMTCLMLSRTFHEEEKIKEVIVPLPAFNTEDLSPICDKGKGKGKEKHETEMDLILRYSPFHTRGEFFEQFRRIESESGTLVILYNLKLLDSGVTELDFKTDPKDILIAGTDLLSDKILVSERYSFRAYVALLYSEPRMKVSIQAKKVQAYRLVYDLYKPRMYKYTSARFKTRSKDDAKKAELEYKTAKQKLVEAEGRARELENSSLGGAMNRNDRIKLRNLQKTADDLKAEVAQKELKSEVKQKSLKEPKTLSFIFGINLENRKNDGLFIYNCNRLIKMYVRVGPQLEGGQKCRGVVGIVNVPYVVLEPTLNKQDFTDAKEYRHLLKTLGEHMEQYWRDVDFGLRSVTEFWENYGYRTSGWEEMPSMESNFVNRRAREKKICLQCDICLNWRVLPFSSSHVGKVFPDNWVCSLNPDASRNRCTCPEEKLVLPEGKYQKIEKSKDEKDAEAAEAIKRIEDKRSKLYQREVVTSTRSAKNTMEVVAQRRVEPVSKRASASEDTSPVKRKRVNKNRASTESSYDDDVYVPSRALRRRAVRSSWESPAAESNHSSESNVTSIDDLWPELSESEFEVPTTIEIFSRVEVEVQNKWHVGTVVRRTGSDFIVRLDRLPFAKYERRISTNSDKIRLSVSRQSIKVQQEMPSSSTACSVPNHNADDVLEDMSKGFKTCLHYFMPPNWEMTKEKIQNLSVDELLSFPLDDFFSKYEDGLRNLIAGFQDKAEAKSLEAEAANREAEAAKAKLNHTNRLIARLLNSIHDECNLDPDTDSDKVDELLQACVAQAEMPSGQMDQVTTSCL